MPTRREFFRLDSELNAHGALAARAHLTRVGIFPYLVDTGEGTIQVREYRPAEEVFSKESLDSLRGAPLVEGHPAFINGDNWARFAKGHIGDDVQASDSFVSATVHVKDSGTVNRVTAKALVELSCAYKADLDPTPGEFQGQPYDVVQRNIRYNHVGLGPENWGRAGNDVRVFLDCADAVSHYDEDEMNRLLQVNRQDSPNAPPAAPAPAPRADAPPAIVHSIDVTALLTKTAALEAEKAALEARVTGLEAAAAAVATASTEQATADAVSERIALLAQAKGLGIDCPVTDCARTIRVKVLAKLSPSTKCDGKSDDAVTMSFGVAVDAHKGASANASGARIDSTLATGAADDVSPIEAARAKQDSKFGGAKLRRFGGAA